MPPRGADRRAARTALLETAARMIAAEGAGALTLRRLAAEAGTSTMAVYTHFGGMPELRRAIRHEGFARLAARLDAAGRHGDHLAQLAALCLTYVDFGLENADLYRVMFLEQALDDEGDPEGGAGAFATLVRAVGACGFDRPDPPEALATQLWSTGHGVVALHLAGLIDRNAVDGITRGVLVAMLGSLAGDQRAGAAAVAVAGQA